MLKHSISFIVTISFISQAYIINAETAKTNEGYKTDNDNMITIMTPMRPRKRSIAETPNNIWSVDVSRSGNFCYHPSNKVYLWRSNANQMDKLQITSNEKNIQINLRWPSEQHKLEWPYSKLPFVEKQSYTLHLNKTNEIKNKITIHQIPDNLSIGMPEFNHWMIQQGCQSQVIILQKML